MQHELDDLAQQVRAHGLVLAYSHDGAKLAFRYQLPAHIRLAIRNHRRGLARLMAEGDVRLCPSPSLHRRAWFYAGRGRYVCEQCVRLDSAQMGMWQKVS